MLYTSRPYHAQLDRDRLTELLLAYRLAGDVRLYPTIWRVRLLLSLGLIAFLLVTVDFGDLRQSLAQSDVRLLALATRLPTWLSKPFLSRAAGAGRGAKMPSFHIDLYAGRTRSEVTYLHGAVVRAGEKLGVPTPVNKLLTETLLALAEKRLPLNTYARQPEKLLAELKTFKP